MIISVLLSEDEATTLAVESFNNSHHRTEFSEHCRKVAVMGSFSCQRMCE